MRFERALPYARGAAHAVALASMRAAKRTTPNDDDVMAGAKRMGALLKALGTDQPVSWRVRVTGFAGGTTMTDIIAVDPDDAVREALMRYPMAQLIGISPT